MRISLLGALTVVTDDGHVLLTAAKDRALLELLALNAGHEVTRDHLVTGLWGEDPPATARKSLQNHVSNLRRALPERAIRTTAHGYVLAVEADAVDVHRFESLVTDGRTHRNAHRLEDAVAALVDALALWRGEPLVDLAGHLPGQIAQVRLRELHHDAEEDLFEVRLELGQHNVLIPELEAAVARDPLREHRWVQLMLALYRAGRQADALRTFARVRQILAEELGIDPGPELQEMEHSLLVQSPDLRWSPPDTTTSTGSRRVGEVLTVGRTASGVAGGATTGVRGGVTIGAGASRTLPVTLARLLDSAPLVGRTNERRRAEQAWAEAVPGPPAVLVLSGAAGIGKSRLAAELARTVFDTGASVLHGRWDEELLRPMQAMAQALSGLLTTSEGRHPSARVAESHPELLWLLPELAAEDPALQRRDPPLDEGDRFRLFESIASWLKRLSTDTPVLVVLDDVQWCDPPTLPLLRHLTDTQFAGAVLLVLTDRSEGLRRAGTSAVVSGLARDRPVTHVHLGGLPERDVGDLVRHLWPDEPVPARLARRLNRITEGNPFFVIQLVRHLIDTDHHDTDHHDAGQSSSSATLSLPTELHVLLGHRLSRLSSATMRALRTAAVIGFEWDIDLLAAALSVSTDEVVDMMEEAIEAEVVTESPMAIDRCRFAHALLRETVYAQLPLSRRRRLHLAVAEVLQRLDSPGGDVADLAYHLIEAQPLGPRQRTVDVAAEAASAAMSAAAYEQAAVLLERAVGLSSAADTEPRRVASLLLALGQAHAAAGDTTLARAAFVHCFEAAARAGCEELMATAALGAGGEWVSINTYDQELEQMLQTALTAMGDANLILRGRLLARFAAARYFALDMGEAERFSLAAVDAARRSGDPGAIAAALHIRHLVQRATSPPEQRLLLARQVIVHAVEADDMARALVGHADATFDLLELGDFDAVDQEILVYEERARLGRRHFDTWWMAVHRAMRAMARGVWSDAERLTLDALRLGEGFQQVDAVVMYGAQLFALRWGQDRLTELRKDISELAASDPGFLAWQGALAVILADEGSHEEARCLLDRMIPSGFAAAPRDGLWVANLAMASQAAAQIGATAACRFLLSQLTPYAGRVALLGPGIVCMGAVDRYRAIVAATCDEWSTADAAFDSALRLNRQIGARPWEALTLIDHADHLSRHDPVRRAEIAALATLAGKIASELPMPAVASRSRQCLTEAAELQ